MPKTKVAITMDDKVLRQLDRLVESGHYPSRSRAIEEAVEERLKRVKRTRLARESAKLDPAFEQTLAEEGLAGDVVEWPGY